MKNLKTFEEFDPIGLSVIAGAGLLIYLTKILKDKLYDTQYDQIIDIANFIKSENFKITEDESGFILKSQSVVITFNNDNNVLYANVEDGGDPIIIRLEDEDAEEFKKFISAKNRVNA
jgi:hypothetical protein